MLRELGHCIPYHIYSLQISISVLATPRVGGFTPQISGGGTGGMTPGPGGQTPLRDQLNINPGESFGEEMDTSFQNQVKLAVPVIITSYVCLINIYEFMLSKNYVMYSRNLKHSLCNTLHVYLQCISNS